MPLTMHLPAFFDTLPSLTLTDPLAALLGAAEAGILTYTYTDAVKLAGHSCPTVAGSWLMLYHGLKALYPADLPVRGQIRVVMSEAESQGVAGVMASIATLVTGAAGTAGFKGLGGQHRRANLLQFDVREVQGILQLERLDSALPQKVSCDLNLAVVPADPRMMPLLQATLAGVASHEEKQAFTQLWQDRVRRILTEHHDDPELVRITAVSA